MPKLIINNKVVTTPIETIISDIRRDTKYMSAYQFQRDNILVSCPYHKNGEEKHPSCSINTSNDVDVPYGTFHCWSCGAKGGLVELVAYCRGLNISQAEEFLTDNYSDLWREYIDQIPPLEDKSNSGNIILPKEILDQYDYNNSLAINYLTNDRHLNKNIIDFFYIGCNTKTNSVTFPCWDEKGNLIGVFERNIFTKRYYIPPFREKPIYLLNAIYKYNYNSVYVVESQINALTLWGWGYPAIALIGTGAKKQYEKLSKSGITNYILCFDGDSAGDKGINKFINAMQDKAFISVVQIPRGKDVNDLTHEEFMSLNVINI